AHLKWFILIPITFVLDFCKSLWTKASRLSLECLQRNYTRLSCSKVFCLPWQRCISGKCVCKLPYQCPRPGIAVCGLNQKPHWSFCHAQAIACRDSKPVFSHYGTNCKDVFEVQLHKFGDNEVVQVKTAKGKALVCASQQWNMAAANDRRVGFQQSLEVGLSKHT
uniref:Factor I / membrane attack complex domain-containing protein n=1 Tax=Astyanax mexicanus TaxID=7994 RepID=A0A3B1J3V4_ASTMX